MFTDVRRRTSRALLGRALDRAAERHQLQDRLARLPLSTRQRLGVEPALSGAATVERVELWLGLRMAPPPVALEHHPS